MKKLSTVFIRDEWLLLGVALFIYFAGIWDQSMPTPDGAHRASMAREVLERATWFPIYYQGHALADHPPLYVWLVALVFKLFGVGDLQFIMVNRVLVTIGVLLLYFAGKSIFEKKGQALFACLMLLVTVGFYQGSVAGNIEPLLNIFLIGAFLSWCRFRKKAKPIYAILCSSAVIMAFLTKGMVALWPFVFFGWKFLQKSSRRHAASFFVPLFLFYISLVFLARGEVFGDFLKRYLSEQVLNSMVEGREESNSFDFLFYFRVLVRQYWPVLPLFVLAVRRLRIADWVGGLERDALIFGLGFFAGFSMAHFKLDYYVQPSFAFFAVFTAAYTFKIVERQWSRWRVGILIASGIFFAFVSLFGPKLHKNRTPEVEYFSQTILTKRDLPIVLSRTPNDDNRLQKKFHWTLNQRTVRIPHYYKFEEAIFTDAWVLTNRKDFEACPFNWCHQSKVVADDGKTILLLRTID